MVRCSKYEGYVGMDVTYEILRNDERMLSIRFDAVLNAKQFRPVQPVLYFGQGGSGKCWSLVICFNQVAII